MSSEKRRTKYYGESDAKVWPADHPVTGRPKARKDTRRWCRGKVGVEHVIAVTVGNWAQSYRFACRRANDRELRLWPGQPWVCRHQRSCTHCAKVLDYSLPWRDCPDLPAVFAIIPEDD